MQVSFGQKITGIWRGSFVSDKGGYKYKYEVQINQLSTGALKGVTYSYRTTVFYGKTDLQGVYMKKAKSLVIKEVKMLEMKIADQSEPCLMTCYLDYTKDGKKEFLKGTYTSINDGKYDCGGGEVVLEKVPESEFKKEDFLVKKQQSKSSNNTANSAKNNKPTTTTNNKLPNTNSAKAYKPKPNTNKPIITNKPIVKKATPVTEKPLAAKDTAVGVVAQKPALVEPVMATFPVPPILKERENSLVKKLVTTDRKIRIQLYDNGEIDSDSISVYHNNKLIVSSKMLSAKPIEITIEANENERVHELVMVAENLGTIPPNTALMVVTTQGKRYELFISSNEKKNAKVVFEFQPN